MKVGQFFGRDNILIDPEVLQFYDEVQLEDGEVLLFQGELTTDLYIIKSGKLEVVEGTGDNAIRLAVLGEEDVFGEAAFFDEEERSATVKSLGSSTVLRMTREQLLEIAEGKPELGIRFLITLGRIASDKLRRTDKLLTGVAGTKKISDDRELKKLVHDIRKAMKKPGKGLFR